MVAERLNILHTIPSLSFGGGERMVIDIANFQRQAGLGAIIGCVNFGGGFLAEAEMLEIPTVIIGAKSVFDPAAVYKTVRLIRKMNVHIVHTNFFEADIIGRVAASICRIPCVTTIHNTHVWHYNKDFKSRAKRWVNRLSANYLTSFLISDSAYVLRHYVDNMGFRCVNRAVLHNPVVTSRFRHSVKDRIVIRRSLNLSDEHFVLLNVGSLTPQKSQYHLVDVMEMLKDKYPEIRLLIVGEGSLKEKLWSYIRKKELNDKIYLLGARKDVPALLSSADAFVLSSEWEGLPISILEAMASGKPIVATAVGGIPEIVEDGAIGFLSPYGNKKSLAKNIAILINDRDKKAILEKNSHESSKKYDISKYHSLLLKVYKQAFITQPDES